MVEAECSIINTIGNWVLKSINLGGYIFGDLAPEIKLKDIQAKGRMIPLSKEERLKILSAMDRQPIITDSTPVASLTSIPPLPFTNIFETTQYNPDAERAKNDCINDYCPGYFRYAAQACLGCDLKYDRVNHWIITRASKQD